MKEVGLSGQKRSAIRRVSGDDPEESQFFVIDIKIPKAAG